MRYDMTYDEIREFRRDVTGKKWKIRIEIWD